MKTSRATLLLLIAALSVIPALAHATALSDLTAATAGNAINNGNNQQTWEWNSLANGTALQLRSNSGAAISQQTVLNLYLSGVNTNSGVESFALNLNNAHTGTNSINYGIDSVVDGGTHNYGVYGTVDIGANAGDVGVWGDVQAGSGATYGVYGTNETATGYGGYFNNSAGGYAAAFMGGNVGIGTATPQSLVQAYGGEVQVGSSGVSCATANNGALRYSGGTLYYCTGTTWTAVAGGSSSPSNGGFINKFRNGTFDIWQRGTSSLATSSSGAYTADGWIVVASGANDTCAQDTGTGGTTYSLKCTGATSNTDTKFEQRIESYMAAPLAGNTLTVQFYFKQNTGTAITPKVSTCYASAQDNFGTCTSDLAGTSLTSCATGAWCLEAYTLNASANASNGYQVTVDCNTGLSSSQSCWLTAADIRTTNGVATGINTSPPPPELRPIGPELALNQRYLQSSYNPWVTPGTSDNNGPHVCLIYATGYTAAQGFRFPVTMRAAPTMNGYAPDGTSGDWIDTDSGLDKAVTFGNPNAAGVRYIQLSGGGTAATSAYCGHYTANSEL